MTPSNYFPKTPLPNTITLRFRALTYQFWETETFSLPFSLMSWLFLFLSIEIPYTFLNQIFKFHNKKLKTKQNTNNDNKTNLQRFLLGLHRL